MAASAPRLPQSVRYLIVTVIGVAVDLAIGWALTALAQVPVSIAALAGFVTAAALNYVLHERWTFAVASAPRAARRGGPRMRARRTSILLVLVVRSRLRPVLVLLRRAGLRDQG